MKKAVTSTAVNLQVLETLDPIFTQIGGIPRGLLIELFGPESAGKTTLASIMLGKAQKAGLKAAMIDIEHVYDFDYATLLGVDTETLYFVQPESGEAAFQEIFDLVREGYALIVVDSVPCLIPEEVLEDRAGIASNPRLVSLNVGKLLMLAAKHQTTVLFLNQIRAKFNVKFGNPETTPGGHALKHNVAMRIEVRKVGWLKYANQVIGFKGRVRTIKNKKYIPYKEAYFEVIFDPDAPPLDQLNKNRKNKLSVEEIKPDER